jgi:hypothetical protein
MQIVNENLTMYEQLRSFVDSRARNAWLETFEWKIYVRKQSYRKFQNECYLCFDIASVEVGEEFQHQGIFTSFLAHLETNYHFNLFVENIYNPSLISILEKRGFTIIPDLLVPSAIKLRFTK